MSKMRAILTIALLSATTTATFTGAAAAGSYNGVCESSNGGEVCLYNTNNFTGAVYDTIYSKPEYTGTYFGTNTPIDNTVTSTWNRDPDTSITFYGMPGYTGGAIGTLPGIKASWEFMGFNNVFSSHCFASNPSCPN
ncbi:peptidase inhibitor family I36 protein [Streptomyces sp. NPDC059352]|uniref:peptidase inhibitor family I36 protein n=1 Tax=Streptomyces sp. NPDC059352 TaxID=3346810 RepID=UPI0036B63075